MAMSLYQRVKIVRCLDSGNRFECNVLGGIGFGGAMHSSQKMTWSRYAYFDGIDIPSSIVKNKVAKKGSKRRQSLSGTTDYIFRDDINVVCKTDKHGILKILKCAELT